MLSHEPKNYALLGYDAALTLRGVAFRSSRAQPYGEAFLRRALRRLLAGDAAGVRDVYLETLSAIKRRELPTREVSSRVRLTKTPEHYLAARETRRELAYEAMLLAGRNEWEVGHRVRVYRTSAGTGGLVDDDAVGDADARDYDIDYYARLLLDTFAARLSRALTPLDFDAVFADPEQLMLFAPSLEDVRPILTVAFAG